MKSEATNLEAAISNVVNTFRSPQPCDVSKFKEKSGVESCLLCDDVIKGSVTFGTSTISSSDCVCPKEFFMNGKKTECLRGEKVCCCCRLRHDF